MPVDNNVEPLSDDSHEEYNESLSPPTHLQLIFDNADVNNESPNQSSESAARLANARSKLQRLVPSKDDVSRLAESAMSWMALYVTFFPTTTTIASGMHLLAQYEHVLGPTAHPTAIGAFLTLLAITVIQIMRSGSSVPLGSIPEPSTFVKKVADAVHSTVVADDDLASTIDGLETVVLYIRLQLGRGHIKNMCLTVRRAVALAELTGLHRLPFAKQARRDIRVALFEAICTTDRMVSMMFNLPAATANYKLPPMQFFDLNGQVVTATYMFELASIAMCTQDIDEELLQGIPYEQVYAKILAADTKLRALASRAPASWWQEDQHSLDARRLVQLLHWYVHVRLHLHSVMRGDAQNQYAYSWNTCVDAGQQNVRRWLSLRSLLPKGFFLTLLLQKEIFTVAVVLLLARQRGVTMTDENRALILEVISALKEDAAQAGTDFALQAAAALESLLDWVETPKSENLNLRIPMIGNVTLGKKQEQADLWPSLDLQDLSWDIEFDVNQFLDDSFFDMQGLY